MSISTQLPKYPARPPKDTTLSVIPEKYIPIKVVTTDIGIETPIINVKYRTVASAAQTGFTDIYAVKFAVQDGFHGVTLTGNSGINTYLPDFKSAGAVKKGEVEMVACVALKNTKAAGVLRNIKIA